MVETKELTVGIMIILGVIGISFVIPEELQEDHNSYKCDVT